MTCLSLASADGSEHTQAVALLVILAVAAAVTMVLHRVRLSAIPGYVLAGALVGPHALGLVANIESVELASEVAILLLMFTIGMHLDVESVRVGLRHIILLGVVTTLVTTLAGWGLGIAFGLSAPVALTISMALSMSSTAIVLRLLIQHRQMNTMHGRIAFGVLLVQDMAAMVMLAMLPPIAHWAGADAEAAAAAAPIADAAVTGHRLWRVMGEAGVAIAGLTVLIAFGRRLLPRLLREAASESSETLLVLSAAVALGAAAWTNFLGFSSELGAFLAGFVLASTPFKYQISGQLSPLRDLFMAVFFTTVGLQLDGATLASQWLTLVVGFLLVVVVKAVVGSVGTWLTGATGPTAFMAGMELTPAGEFSLVILSVAGGLGIISGELMAVVVGVVVLSLAAAPAMYVAGERLKGRFAGVPAAGWVRQSPLREADHPAAHAGGTAGDADGAELTMRRVIIAGYGLVGRNVAQHLGAAGVGFTIVELNPETVSRQRQLGRSIIFGDIANPDVLETAGIHDAEAVILTIPDDEATLRACRAIRSMSPKVFIAARTAHMSLAIAAQELGADHVTVEEVATAEAMARQVMPRLMAGGEKGDPAGGAGR